MSSVWSAYNNQEFQLITSNLIHTRFQNGLDEEGKEVPVTMQSVVGDNIVMFDFLNECRSRGIPHKTSFSKSDKIYSNKKELLEGVMNRIKVEWKDITMPEALNEFIKNVDVYWNNKSKRLNQILASYAVSSAQDVFRAKLMIPIAELFTKDHATSSFLPEAQLYLIEMLLFVEMKNYTNKEDLAIEQFGGFKQMIASLVEQENRSSRMNQGFSGYNRKMKENQAYLAREARRDVKGTTAKELPTEYTSESKIIQQLDQISEYKCTVELEKLNQRIDEMFEEQPIVPAREVSTEQEEAMEEIRRQRVAQQKQQFVNQPKKTVTNKQQKKKK